MWWFEGNVEDLWAQTSDSSSCMYIQQLISVTQPLELHINTGSFTLLTVAQPDSVLSATPIGLRDLSASATPGKEPRKKNETTEQIMIFQTALIPTSMCKPTFPP